MKKFRLNLQHFENAEVLTRSQLKNVLGGGVNQTTGNGTYCASSNNCAYTTLENGKLVYHNGGTCASLTGIQSGCACNGQISTDCDYKPQS